MIKFEKVAKYADVDINMPCRKTTGSAGYDMEVAEDIVIPSIFKHWERMENYNPNDYNDTGRAWGLPEEIIGPIDLDYIAVITKYTKARPTLVPTGVKCYLEKDTYLELAIRSSGPLKHWLIMGNSVGIIDSDYADNPDNEGHIYFQIINLSPFDIQLKKGDIIGQGIIKKYLTTDDDTATGKRVGGFGSTSNV